MAGCSALIPPPFLHPFLFLYRPSLRPQHQSRAVFLLQPGTTVSPRWGHEAMWLSLQEMGRIIRTGRKEYTSVKCWTLMLTEVWIEVVDVRVPNLTRKQSGWWIPKKNALSTVRESTLVGSRVTYNCTPMDVFSLEVGWNMCGEAEMPLMCLSYFFGFCFILWLSSPSVLFW